MEEVKLREATISDLDRIAKLAHLIWHQHYPAIIGLEQVEYMLDKMYSQDSLLEQIQIKKHRFFMIGLGNEEIGFVSVNQEDNENWFLNKFYIDQTRSAKGVGTLAFRQLISTIHPEKISLTVNRGNYKSINFYFKLGFIIEKTAVFDIGNNYVMDDFIMVWKKK